MSLFGLFKKKPKIEGSLGYFGLGDWWLSTFSDKEREYIERTFRPMGHSQERPLTEGHITSTSETAVGLLGALAGWFQKAADRPIAKRILEKAEQLARHEKAILDVHFLYMNMIESFYRERETEPGALEAAIDACQKQISLAPKAAQAFRREYPKSPLPAHTGYTQLSIIWEKQGNYAGAIAVAKQAKKQGWNGDWEKRIERCEGKLHKSQK